MTISEIIAERPQTEFSLEVLPPLKGKGTTSLFKTIDRLMNFQPRYINITTHRSEYVYKELADGTFRRDSILRRPGTIAVASAISRRYDVEVVPHVVCSGFTRQEIEYMLLDLQFLDIHHLLLLRGDKAKDDARFVPTKGGHSHTTELIEQVNRFNEGYFLDGSNVDRVGEPFSFGVACYPEKHEEAPNLDFDLDVLRRKQELGADYAITQMFFDNKKYFSFVDEARRRGITIPIIPGIKPIAKLNQLNVVPKTFHLDLPTELSTEMQRCKSDEDVKRVGVEWGIEQCKELIREGVPCIHFYTLGATDSICEIAKEIY